MAIEHLTTLRTTGVDLTMEITRPFASTSQLSNSELSTNVNLTQAAPWTQDFASTSQPHAASTSGARITFIDAGVSDYQTFVNAAAPGTQVKLLDPSQNAIEQITDYLAGQSNLSSIHIISHGEAGGLDFSSMKLDLGDLADYSTALQSWAKALAADADILLYGCDVAANDQGKAFVQTLSQLTGADVAASTDLTGNAAQGGNWNLEFSAGAIESPFAFDFNALSSYTGTLDNILTESFTGADVSEFNWIYNTASGTTPYLTARNVAAPSTGGLPGGANGAVDTAGNGALRLTSANGNQSSFVIYDQAINNASGLSISFDLFSYGGTTPGADGISFFLIDGSADPTSAGAYGGSLGYASRDQSTGEAGAGLSGGYLGIGFDEYGNFSNAGYGTSGNKPQEGFKPQSVVLRGRENPSAPGTGYQFLDGRQVTLADGTNPSGPIDSTSTVRANAKRLVHIELTSTGALSVQIDLNNDGQFVGLNENPFTNFDLVANNGALPGTFKFGFAASTGGSTNIHEIRGLQIDTYNDAPYIPLVQFTQTTGTMVESGNLTVTAQLDRVTTADVTIPVNLTGTATGADYTVTPASITIAAGQTTGTLVIQGIDDTVIESNETVIVTMGTPINAKLNPENTVFTATITDNDTPSNNAPTLTVAGTVKYLEETPPILVAPGLAIGSAAPTTDTLNGATVTLNSGLNPGDRLSIQNTSSGSANGISWNYTAATGVLSLTGTASVATYQALLQQVAYNNTTATPNSINRSVTYSLQYGSNQTVNGSSAVTLTLDGEHGNTYYGDFNGDGKGDLLWRNQVSGQNAIWLMNGTTTVLQQYIDTVADLNWQIEEVGDFNGDGKADILWRSQVNGQNAIWLMNGTTAVLQQYIDAVADTNWQIEEVGDFNADGKADITWRNYLSGQNAIWLMNSTSVLVQQYIDAVADANWQIEEVGDFNGDGRADITWRNHLTGQNAIWLMNGTSALVQQYIDAVADTNWRVTAVADFNGGGKADILWRNYSTGQSAIWQMNGITAESQQYLATTVTDLNWRVTDVLDFNGDGRADLFWRNYADGQNAIWQMNGIAAELQQYVSAISDTNWRIYRG